MENNRIERLITGESYVEVTLGETTEVVSFEVPDMKQRIGDPINGHYTTVFATTKEKRYLLVEINEWHHVVRAEFYDVE